MAASRCLPAIAAFVSTLTFALTPAAQGERIEFGAILETETAIETKDGDVQKFDTILTPEFKVRFTGDTRLTAIGRIRADPVDRLEPGRPEQDTRSDLSNRAFANDATDLELREFYLDTAAGDTYLRIGKQQVVWGQADGLRVLDVVNPFSFREFTLPDFEDRRIPLWTINAEIPVGEAMVQLLWIPDQTYNETPDPDAVFAFTSPLVVPYLPPGVPVTVQEPNRPDNVAADADAGVRFSAFLGGWDVSLNYLYHYQDEAVPFQERKMTETIVAPEFERTHLFGGTFSGVFGDVTLRGEFGYSTDRYFVTRDLADADGVVKTSEFGSVLGLDYNGIDDFLISAQVFGSFLGDHPDGIVRDRVEGRASLLIERTFLNDILAARILVVSSLNDGDGLIQFDLPYNLRSNVVLKLGADVFYGARDGLFGQFGDADRVTFGVEIGF